VHELALDRNRENIPLLKKKKRFIYGCAGSSLLCWLLSSWGATLQLVGRLFIEVASLAAEHRL